MPIFSLRVWEWDTPVDVKYIADPGMHSLPFVARSPNGKWLAAQSLDNKISVYACPGNRFKHMRKKIFRWGLVPFYSVAIRTTISLKILTFRGHETAGYACGVSFSPDMSYLASGDGDGKVYVWEWRTTRPVCDWRAHEGAVLGVLWHPHETSKMATAGWDGAIKFWD